MSNSDIMPGSAGKRSGGFRTRKPVSGAVRLRQSDSVLHIFISHKMPADTDLARRIGVKLALYGGKRVKVTHAGDFDYGSGWRNDIKTALSEADWLIYLHTGQDEDWGFCLYECGMFAATLNQSGKERPLISFCRDPSGLNGALQEFNALVMDESSVAKLMVQIYRDPPRELKGDLDDETIKKTSKEIVDDFMKFEREPREFDVAPNIIFEVDLNETGREILNTAHLPNTTFIYGKKEWYKLFGKDIDTGRWEWLTLKSDWQFAAIYDFLISTNIRKALNGEAPRGILLRMPEADARGFFRMTLRRYEKVANSTKQRFYFTAAPVDLPFDVPSDHAEKAETTLYHLINLTWYFRRRFVDDLYSQLLELLAKPDRDGVSIRSLCEDIAYELMDIGAQAIVRHVDSPLAVEEALKRTTKNVKQIMEHANEWYTLQPEILKIVRNDPVDLVALARSMYKISKINYELYRVTANAYFGASKRLKEPRNPG